MKVKLVELRKALERVGVVDDEDFVRLEVYEGPVLEVENEATGKKMTIPVEE